MIDAEELEENLRRNKRDRQLIGFFMWVLTGVSLFSIWVLSGTRWQWLAIGLAIVFLTIGLHGRRKVNRYLERVSNGTSSL